MSTAHKSKDEILNDRFGEMGDANRELTSKPYRAVLEAMDEYAKQEAIGFENWLAENFWIRDPFPREQFDDGQIRYEQLDSNPPILKTAEQLYNLYLKSKTP